MLGELNKQWWTSKDRVLIRREHMELVAGRYAHMEEYRTSHGKLDQLPEGNRKSPAFVPAAKLDLITLTLDILVRDPVTDATESQREALWDAYREFENVAFIQAKENVIAQRLAQRAWIEAQATDGVETVKGALQRLFPQTNTVQAADHVAIELPA
ncbi:hypothetical protein H4582DRAFT_1942073 [Lactarius indigo]|nr:hypothetical protein H4582DRAFT_1942073 [Lactarius indigo]